MIQSDTGKWFHTVVPSSAEASATDFDTTRDGATTGWLSLTSQSLRYTDENTEPIEERLLLSPQAAVALRDRLNALLPPATE